jgi:hypothetical protein
MSKERTVHVNHTIVIEYEVPVKHYPGMTEDEIIKYEKDIDNLAPETLLENVTSQSTMVWLTGDNPPFSRVFREGGSIADGSWDAAERALDDMGF